MIEAVYWLAVARVMLVVVPFDRLSKRLSALSVQGSSPADNDLIRRVGWAVTRASTRVPWRADCFPQAIAACKVLQRRGQTSTMHIGVLRNHDGTLVGHAWLVCGDQVVTGGVALERYSVLHTIPETTSSA